MSAGCILYQFLIVKDITFVWTSEISVTGGVYLSILRPSSGWVVKQYVNSESDTVALCGNDVKLDIFVDFLKASCI